MRTADHADTAYAGIWPAAHSGRWSLRLIAPAGVATVASMVAVATGRRGGCTDVTSAGVEGAVPR
jgi:hypothetical protein